jgi:hypothetical protein
MDKRNRATEVVEGNQSCILKRHVFSALERSIHMHLKANVQGLSRLLGF